MVKIEISEAAFTLLRRWASVGRTIDTTVKYLDEYADLAESGMPGQTEYEDLLHCRDELEELKYALNDCNRACKNTQYPARTA